MPQAPTQKFGYLDIKQSSKVRPRKLKSWRRRWAVLTKLSNLSNDENVAKLDLYDNETKWRSNSSNKMTLVLENVTCIQTSTSRTHKHAFEVVERQPMLVMSGATELESYSWILTLRQMFTPEQIEITKDYYNVTVIENTHSIKWNLIGELTLTISPTCISLEDLHGSCLFSWGLHMLMRFNVEKNPATGEKTVLVIESGQNAPTGHSCFHFLSDKAQDILNAIRHSICLALAQKQQARSVVSPQQRKLSPTVSERNIQDLFDNHPVSPSVLRSRSHSGSSSSTINNASPTIDRWLSSSPVPSFSTDSLNADTGLLIHTKQNTQAIDVQRVVSNTRTHELETNEQVREQTRTRSSSFPKRSSRDDSGYSEIKDVAAERLPREDSFTPQLLELNFDRLRSVSAVVASINASIDHKPGRSVSSDNNNDNKSDLDSAISSMSLSPTNDEFPWKDMLHCQDLDFAKRVDPYIPDKKKSSSTPDLQAYWKKHNEVRNIEHVYEELDELRASLQKFSKEQDSHIPPALPARPLSLHFMPTADYKAKVGLKKKISIFKRHRKYSAEIKDMATSLYFCENVKGEKSHYGSDCTHCTVNVGAKIFQRAKSHIIKTASSEELIGSTCSSINDINDIKDAFIPELKLAKRRRSSDITPVSSSFCFDAHTTDAVVAKAGCLPLYQKDAQGLRRSNLRVQQNLISTREEGKDYNEMGAVTSESFCRSAKNDPENPLISFFLDDDNFESNPMVTGNLPIHSTPLSSNIDLLTHGIFPSGVPQVPLSPSALENQALTLQKLKPESCTGSQFGLSANQFSTFDIWNIEEVPNQHFSFSRGMSVPPSFSAPFSPDPFQWNQKRVQGISPQTRSTQNRHNNYMTMMMKSDISRTELNNDTIQRKERPPSITDKSEHLTVSEKQVEDIYVRPTVTAMGESGEQH